MKIVVENARRTRDGQLMATLAVADADGRIVHSDTIALGKASARHRFVEALKDRVPDTSGVEATLLKLLAEISAEVPFRPSGPSDASDASDSSEQVSLTPPFLVEVMRTPQGLAYWFIEGLRLSIAVEGVTYRPPKAVDLYPLPTQAALAWVLLDSDAALFDDIAQFIYDHVDLPHECGHRVLAAWVLHTYLIERFDYSPIPWFHGPKGSGKTTASDVIGFLSRRPIPTVSLTGPALFRVNQHYNPTLLIDEVRLVGRDRNPDVVDLLNARFSRGRRVVRVNTDKQGLESIESFQVYGATVLSGTEDIPDTCASRSIPFVMERNGRPVRRTMDKERLAALRDRLYAFRCRHLRIPLPEAPRFVRDGRLDDVLMPLHQIVLLVKPEFASPFVAFGQDLERRRSDEEAQGLDAEVVRALTECERLVEKGKLSVRAVADRVNEARSEGEKLGLKTMGGLLSRLGFEATRTSTGHAARWWDSKRVDRLRRRYIDPDESEASDEPEATEGLTKAVRDVSPLTDGLWDSADEWSGDVPADEAI